MIQRTRELNYAPSNDRFDARYNWSTGYKAFVALQMSFLTFAVYVGSSIYSSGISGPNPDSVTQHFDVSQTTGLVGLTVFVLGYGVGPMLWAPVSEFPQVGRLPVYVGTLVIFVGVQFPTIYANNIHTLLAMRFLAGFFGSPCLAIGGATMGDVSVEKWRMVQTDYQMFKPKHLAYAIGVWGCGAVCGPVLGPLLGGFTYQAKGWTWPLWVLTWLSGLCLVLIIIFFPETSSKNVRFFDRVICPKLTSDPSSTHGSPTQSDRQQQPQNTSRDRRGGPYSWGYRQGDTLASICHVLRAHSARV
jgi:DHA1 family multidrug resistance protein-like MFS transporter